MTLGQRDNLSQAVLTVSVTCVFDRRIHEVRELDIAPAARHGRYPALCGQVITAASMAEPGPVRGDEEEAAQAELSSPCATFASARPRCASPTCSPSKR